MKKMKRVLVALLSCLTAFACLAGTVACGEDKKADSSTNNTASSVTESSKEEVASSEEASKEEESSEEVSSEEVSSEEVSSEEESSSEEASSEEESSSDEEEPHECDLTKVVKSVAASCKDGYIQYGCECGELGELVVIPATGEHVLTQIQPKPATCTEAGYKAYLGCLNCDYNANAGEEPVAPVKPQWADFVVFGEAAPSMYAQALVEYEAEYDEYKDAHAKWEANQVVVLPAKGHFWKVGEIKADGEKYADSEAKCVDYGYTIESYCLNCYNLWVEENAEAMAKAKDEAGEDWDALKYVAENCDALTIKFAAALGHDWVNPEDKKSSYVPGKPATCTETGYTWSGYCYVCDTQVSEKEDIAKLGHDYERGDVNEDKVIDEKDLANAKSKFATCTNDAYCAICDYTDEGTMKAHDYEEKGSFDATCTTDGLVDAQVCKVCGDMTGDIVEAEGHSWDEIKTKQEFEEEKEDEDFELLCAEKWYEDHFICTECGVYGQAKYNSKPDADEGEDWDDLEYSAINVVAEKEVIHKTGAAHKLYAVYENAEGEEKETKSIKSQLEAMHKDYIEGETTEDDEWESKFGSYELTIYCENCDEYEVAIDAEAHSYEYLADLLGNFSEDEVTIYVDADGNEYTEEEIEWLEEYATVPENLTEYVVKAYAKDTVRKCSICSMTMCDINEEHYYLSEVDVKDEAAVKAVIDELAEKYELVIKAEDFAAFYANNYVEEKAATCKSEGNRAYVICLCCGATLVEDGGDFVTEIEWDGQTVAAKDAIKIEKVSAHDWKYVAAVLPTCEDKGHTAHKVCKICGVKDGYKEVAALGHKSSVTGSCADTVECDGYWYDWKDADNDGIVDEGEAKWHDCTEQVANKNKAPHTFDKNGDCLICGAECAHKFVDGECTICKKED